MLGIAFGLAFLGYSLGSVLYYGLDLVRGGNDKFTDLLVPGRYQGPAPKDGGGGQGPSGRATDTKGQDVGPAASGSAANPFVPGGNFTAPGSLGANGDAPSQTPGQKIA